MVEREFAGVVVEQQQRGRGLVRPARPQAHIVERSVCPTNQSCSQISHRSSVSSAKREAMEANQEGGCVRTDGDEVAGRAHASQSCTHSSISVSKGS